MANDNNSLIVQTLLDNENPTLFLLIILNSKLTSFRFIKTFGKLQRGIFPQFKIKELQTFPIPYTNSEIKQMLSNSAKYLISLNRKLTDEIRKSVKLLEIEYKLKKISRNILFFYTIGLNPFLEELEKLCLNLTLLQKEITLQKLLVEHI